MDKSPSGDQWDRMESPETDHMNKTDGSSNGEGNKMQNISFFNDAASTGHPPAVKSVHGSPQM